MAPPGREGMPMDSDRAPTRKDIAGVAPRRYSWWKRLLFSVVPCLGVFVAAELVLWMSGVKTVLEREDPFRGFSDLVSIFERKGDRYRIRPVRGYQTFNKQSFLARKPDNDLRVFCLGGSSAYGFPWEAPLAFTAILGDVLSAAHPDLDVEAINVAGMSYAMHRLKIVAREVIKHEPDIFIVYSGHNEFVEPAFFDALKSHGRAFQRVNYIFSHLRIYAVFRYLVLRRPPAKARLAKYVRREQFGSHGLEEKRRVVGAFRDGLREIVRLAHRHGVKVVLATVPCNIRNWRPKQSLLGAGLGDQQRAIWTAAFHSGKQALEAGRFEEAVSELRSAATAAPYHAETFFLLGQAYEGLKRWDEAGKSYRLACDKDASPIRRLSQINQAIAAVASEEKTLLVDVEGDFEQRSEHGLVGFNLIEDYVHPTREGHQIIAWLILQAMEKAGWLDGEHQTSRQLFDRVIAERSAQTTAETPHWLFNQAVVLDQQGYVDRALAKYRQALEVSPYHIGALFNLAQLLAKGTNLQEAVALVERVLQRDPDLEEGRILYGGLLDRLGRKKEAIIQLRQALRINKDAAEAYHRLGKVFASQNRLEKAVVLFRRALQIRADHAAAHYHLASVLAIQGKIDEAIRHYRGALRVRPDYVAAYRGWGRALASQGRLEEAIRKFRWALQLQDAWPKIHLDLGRVLVASSRPEEAAEHFRRAVDLDPDWSAPCNELAWLLVTCPQVQSRGEFEAIRLAERAARLTGSRDVTVLDTLAAAYAAAGRFDQAVETAEKALALVQQGSTVELTDHIRERLELYRAGKPYRGKRVTSR